MLPVVSSSVELSFNSLAPRGANLNGASGVVCIKKFQLTRPAGGEPCPARRRRLACRVSTHSPRGGRTIAAEHIDGTTPSFNSLAPRGANLEIDRARYNRDRFQLTRPAGGEPISTEEYTKHYHVSTHSPRGGRTKLKRSTSRTNIGFQLTRPAGGEPPSPCSLA